MMAHPLWLAQNLMIHPFVRAQNLVTHPHLFRPTPTLILIDQSLISTKLLGGSFKNISH